ncbi:unnamed protein product [Mytilus edulis]|uniref:Tyr recombinase domain-containing protein n=1 Tax=Mytilus edulis TaxID=6550 RepID=A0A8S3R6M8_MYTED|nr:unnamed protein product [Mytilus edulis]
MCKIVSEQVKLDLVRSGFVPKAEKSLWEPTKRLVWLGTFIDTENGFYKIPDNRINKMIHSIDDIISCLTGRKSVFVKKVASVVGQIISTYLVIGNLVYLMTKHLTIDVNTSASWYSYIKLSESSIEQLQFWKLYISEVNAFESEINFLPPALHTNVDVLVDLLSESKADSTVKTYHAGFIRWKKWAVHNGISRCDILPAKSLHVALYLSSLVQNSRTASPVISAFYSIQWAHHMIGQTSPTVNLVVKNVLEGAKRRLATRIEKKEPVTPELLSKMYSSSFKEYNVMSQRIICACLLAYSGFLRVSELLNIRRCDINFELGYISIFIPKSKTDIYRDGNSVVIACMDSDMCPVKNLKLYLLWADISPESEEFIFRNLTKFKDRYVLRKENKSLSYTQKTKLYLCVELLNFTRSFNIRGLKIGNYVPLVSILLHE